MGAFSPPQDVSTLRTSDWDMPNCRAITNSLMPALNAARTALILPRVKEPSPLTLLSFGRICPFVPKASSVPIRQMCFEDAIPRFRKAPREISFTGTCRLQFRVIVMIGPDGELRTNLCVEI